MPSRLKGPCLGCNRNNIAIFQAILNLQGEMLTACYLQYVNTFTKFGSILYCVQTQSDIAQSGSRTGALNLSNLVVSNSGELETRIAINSGQIFQQLFGGDAAFSAGGHQKK